MSNQSLALFVVSGSKCETLVVDKLYDHSDYVIILKEAACR